MKAGSGGMTLWSLLVFYVIIGRMMPDKERTREHRQHFADIPDFDEGLLRRRSLFMWPGRLQTIRFEFSGPSVQAVFDELPTAKIIECSGGKYPVEAEVYGDGINMWLLIQGEWIKVTLPPDFVGCIKKTIFEMAQQYETDEHN